MKILSEHNDPKFLIDNIPIRQLFDQAHLTIKPITTPARTPSHRIRQTPVTTVCSILSIDGSRSVFPIASSSDE